MLFVIDCERGRRLKIWGRAKGVDDDPSLLCRSAMRITWRASSGSSVSMCSPGISMPAVA